MHPASATELRPFAALCTILAIALVSPSIANPAPIPQSTGYAKSLYAEAMQAKPSIAVLPDLDVNATAIRKALADAFPAAKIEAVRATPIPGLMEVDVPGDVLYVSHDGRYVINGSLLELATHRDLTEASRAIARRRLLRGITSAQTIVFAPSHAKYTVTVFTDLDCGYCRKLHAQIADFNRAGIAVDYVFWPRSGLVGHSYDKAVSVWCAADRRKAFTDAKQGLSIPKATCANPVAQDYNLGLTVGVDGTPAIFASDGTQMGGYLTPADLKAKLDQLSASPRG